jgi:hypothetical protein
MSLRLLEVECVSMFDIFKLLLAIVNLSLFFRNIFYQAIILGQGGTLHREQKRERALEAGVETFHAAVGALPVIGHLYEVLRVGGKVIDITSMSDEDLHKMKNNVDRVQDYINAYDQAISIWGNRVEPLKNAIQTQLGPLIP